MTQTDYANQFRLLMDLLANTEHLSILKAQVAPGLSINHIQAIGAQFGIDLQPELIEFYQQINGCRILWEVDAAELSKHPNPAFPESMMGSIDILNLEHMLLGGNAESPWKELLWFDFMDESLRDELEKFRPFDFYFRDDKECVGFKLEGNKLGHQLMHYSQNYGLTALDLSLHQYLDKTLIFKGFLFWQRALLFGSGKYKQELNLFLPQIFPDDDWLSIIQTELEI